MNPDNIQLVWFKRDLRVEDHWPLVKASRQGVVLPLYIIEPKLWQQPDLSFRHYAFLQESLASLKQALSNLGTPLIIRTGEAVTVFKQLTQELNIKAIWSHQETWNYFTYQRDLAVKNYLTTQSIPWHEISQTGVIRCLKNRDGWAKAWYRTMSAKKAPAVSLDNGLSLTSDKPPKAADLGLKNDHCAKRQKGGRDEAIAILNSFLKVRGEPYTKAMSSPVTAYDSCSRISPYLAFGVISLREVFQKASLRSREIQSFPYGQRGQWASAMRSFLGRLRWHCHFIQKLEDEPAIEFDNVHKGYDGIRDNDFNEAFFNAWKQGITGFPMIDASMRALITTGWINFRMRAMLMSFASYHLWLHWRPTSLYLARLFVDYEPGIHYNQCQMQSGTTGINAIRIYSPTKQAIEQDPEGIFIKQWLPELKDMPIEFIHTPWKAPLFMGDYPMPIIDEKSARKKAADIMFGTRKNPDFRQQAKLIYEKHGSRKK